METEDENSFGKLKALSYLPFDSEIFGFPFFRLITKDKNQLSRDLESLRKLPAFGCDAKVDINDLSYMKDLKNEGFVFICDQITFGLSPANSKWIPDKNAVKLTYMDSSKIAFHADNFKNDRLSLDSRISKLSISQFYSKWIANSFSFPGKTIYSLQSGLCITHQKKNILKIDLVSVLEKKKGVGSRLIEHTLAQSSQTKVSCVEVTTEAHNTGAIKVYTRNGFAEQARSSCLHMFHNENQYSA